MAALSLVSSQEAIAEEERARQRSVETFLTRADSWSGAQVIQAVRDLNSGILQFAASAVEMCVFASPPSTTGGGANALGGTNGAGAGNGINNAQWRQAFQDTSARIGGPMTKILATRDHSQDPLLVQLALQGCLCLCIARALSSFCIGFPSKSDAVLAQIYNHMHLSGELPFKMGRVDRG